MKYFGTDGIRGIPLKDLSLELISNLSKAFVLFEKRTIILGTDTRESKDVLAFQMITSCLARGFDVIYVGVISTPGLLYLSKIKKAIGIMISASHNPYQDNGIKIAYQGEKISVDLENKLEEYMELPFNLDASLGKYSYDEKFIKEYHLMLSQYIVPSDKKIIIDCANGATYKTAPFLFHLITPYLDVIGDQPDGRNINENCGSTHAEYLAKKVLEKKYDLGIAFDGDGDRVIFVNDTNEIVTGDILIYIIACYLKDKKKLKHNQVALTIMSNPGIIQALKDKEIEVVETPVGDKYIKEAIKNYDLSLGGEDSGHIIISDAASTGDGVLTAMFILRILEETHTKLSDWMSKVTLYPVVFQNIYVRHKNQFKEALVQSEIKKLKDEANEDCKIIVRPSGTEECIRMSIMAKTKNKILSYQERLKNLILSLDALEQ